MSESGGTNETTPLPRGDLVERTPATGVRFTPLRSTPVDRNGVTQAKHREALSPLVPERRRPT